MIAPAASLARFVARQTMPWAPGACGLDAVAQTIAASAFVGPDGPRRRRPAVCADGTPVLLSHKADSSADPSFRLHVEPGAASLDVAQQVSLTLATLDTLIGTLGWRCSAAAINAMVAELLPPDRAQVAGWWGGLGLGCASVKADVELRLYANTREGSDADGWARMGRALAAIWDLPRAAATITHLVGHVAPHARPVGIAVSLREGAIAGVRLYFSVSAPSSATILAAGMFSAGAGARIGAFVDAYAACRPLDYGCVTVGFDFAKARHSLQPLRTKADFNCTPAPGYPCAAPGAMRTWLAGRHHASALDPGPLLALLDDIDHCFGGHTVDYVSVGERADGAELTTYLLPAGFATP